MGWVGCGWAGLARGLALWSCPAACARLVMGQGQGGCGAGVWVCGCVWGGGEGGGYRLVELLRGLGQAGDAAVDDDL